MGQFTDGPGGDINSQQRGALSPSQFEFETLPRDQGSAVRTEPDPAHVGDAPGTS